MDEKSVAHSVHPPTRKASHCEVCGISSHEKTLVGLRNDYRRDGPKFCLTHHPNSMAGSVPSIALLEAL